ncbi:MAG: hypothetical protein QM766_28240 [Burkholderiaceae bacterium]
MRELLLAACIAYVLGGMVVSWSVMPQVAPGVFSGIGVGALVVCSVLTRSWSRVDRPLLIAIITYLALYIIGTYVSYALTGAKNAERWGLLSANATVLGVGLLYFLAGAALAAERRWGVPAGLIAACGIVVSFVLAYWDELTSARTAFGQLMDGVVYEYQQIGDSFALSALALMGVWQLRSRRVGRAAMPQALGFVALSIVVLFVNPSRSAAFLGASCLLLALVLRTLVLRTRGRWRTGLIAGLLVGAAVLAMQPASELAGGSRFGSLSDGRIEEVSVEGREAILEHGWQAITEHPLTGEWALDLERMGVSGLHVHNALDIWAQAGIVPFIAFLVVWALVIDKFFSGWRSSPRCYGAALPLLAFALLSWVTSRHAAYILPFVGLGFFAATVARVESRDRRTRAGPGGSSYCGPDSSNPAPVPAIAPSAGRPPLGR